MKKITKNMIMRVLRKITFNIFVYNLDMIGTIKNVEIPINNLEKALNNEMMFDGSSILGFVRIDEADVLIS